MTNGKDPIKPIRTITGGLVNENDWHWLEGSKVVLGLTKREHFASMANVDVDGYSQLFGESVLNEKCPDASDLKGRLLFWAKFKAYLKVLEADLLIEALNK